MSPHASHGGLKFEIDVGDGRGALLLKPTAFSDWFRVEQLELEIPQIRFPLDITGGVAQFQRDRCRVNAAALVVDERALDAFVRARVADLAGAGFEGLELRFLDRHVEASGRVRVGAHAADFTARALVAAEAGGVRITVGPVRVFGFLPRPAAIVGHDLVTVLAAAVPLEPGEPAAPDAAVMTGLGDVRLRPLDLFLARVFATRGWCVPESGSARLDDALVTGGRVEARYHLGVGTAAPSEDPPELLRALEITRAADDLLVRGDVDGAAATYRFELARARAHAPFLSERLLGVLVARPGSHPEAKRLAEETLARWPNFAAARLVLAQIAATQGLSRAAAEQLGALVKPFEEAGDDEDAVRAALAAARLWRDVDRARARELMELVLKRRPGNQEAQTALAEHYQASGDWQPLAYLWKRRADSAADPADKARLGLQVARIWLDQLGDPRRAREELEATVALDPQSAAARELLAQALCALDQPGDAIVVLEELARLRAARRDDAGEGRTHARMAELWALLGVDERAEAAWRKALERLPGDADVLAHLVAVAERREQLPDAIDFAEQLAEMLSMDDPRRKGALKELVRLLLKAGDAERTRRWLEQVEDGAFGLVARAALEEREGRLEEATLALSEAASRVSGTPAANLHLRRAGLLDQLGRADEAHVARAAAFESAPTSEFGLRAAEELARAAAAAGDEEAEAQWLDAVLSSMPAPAPAGHSLRRVELHLACGEAAAARDLLDQLASQGLEGAALRPLLVRALAALGDHAGRAATLEEQAREGPENERAAKLLEAATAWIAAVDRARALVLAREASALAPGSAEVRHVLGDIAWHTGAWDEVVTMYETLPPEDRPAERVEASRRLGAGLEQQGRGEEALLVFQAAVELPGAAGEPLAGCFRRIAEAYERQGRLRQAIDAWRAAATDERTGDPPERRADLRVRAARLLHRRLNRAAEAEAELQAALAIVPTHEPALHALDAILAERGVWTGAENPEPQEVSDTSTIDAGMPALAVPDAEPDSESESAPAPAPEPEPERVQREPSPSTETTSVAATPDILELEAELKNTPLDDVKRHLELHHLLALKWLEAGNLTRARDYVDRVLHEVPKHETASRMLAAIHGRAGNWAQAADTFERIAAALSGSPAARAQAFHEAAELRLTRLGAEADAVELWLKAADADPTHSPSAARLVEHFWQRGDVPGVVEFAPAAPLDDRARAAAIAVAAALAQEHQLAARALAALGADGAMATREALAQAARFTAPAALDAASHLLEGAARKRKR